MRALTPATPRANAAAKVLLAVAHLSRLQLAARLALRSPGTPAVLVFGALFALVYLSAAFFRTSRRGLEVCGVGFV
jgi:hypothetical protein